VSAATGRVPTKKLVALLGKNVAWRISKTALPPEERAALSEKLPALRDLKKSAEERMNARRAELLKDAEYQRLVAEYKAAREASEQAASKTHHRPICVGTSSGMFFMVKAEGDTWAEVIAKLEKQP
jgi:hypothetical protein